MNDALERLGDARPMGRDETIQREPSSQQQRAEEARLCNSSQWERTDGDSQTTAHANCSSGRSSEAERTQLPQRKKRVSWAIDESLQTVVFLPPTARALILRALEMVNIWVDDTEERCSGGGLSVRAFFQASLLRLQAWATGELDALRPEYTNRHGKPVSYQQEYAQAWSALAELYKGNAAKLFAAATDGDRGVKLLSVSAITLPCVHTALEHTQGGGECGAEGERVLVDALAALRDDAGLAATATEQEGSAKHAQVPAEAEEKVVAAVAATGEAEENDEDDALAMMCSALDALHNDRNRQQLQGGEIAAAARDLVVCRLEQRQAERDRLMSQLGLSDASSSEI